jgi:hypothetical protein
MRTPVVDSKEAPIVGEHGLLCPPALITVHPRSRSSATDPTCTHLAAMVLIERFSDISVRSAGTNASGPRRVVFVGSYRVRPRRVMTAAMWRART